ncbi:CoA transferase [Oceanobacillus piezotolerans]|uniref:CoA transferase n=1 Tax=Oceanobacillus piezotolerans TaxID=2448030 RepID=A0A498DK08_9BACI|nr:CoA transferase [Oceanobacillus piezotolerans]RLL46812.1 CoA transferase [Oceanobacillus piezotolerans]
MPLTSTRVLDLTRLLPGPYCTMILADFGAEVIKIEHPNGGDYLRDYQPKVDENSAFFHSLNRGKKSITLDLKDDQDKEAFLKLVEQADVLVESFRPGVMEKLGLDYEILRALNPRLVYCAITGFGQTGPYAEQPGHDINFISLAGLLNLMGERNSQPIIPTTQIADIGGGALPATIGILLALIARNHSGKGQLVDISMMDGVISWLQATLPNYLSTNQTPSRGEQLLDGGRACYAVYETKDKRYLSVGALEPKFWNAFCKTIGREDLTHQLEAPLNEQYRMKYEIQTIILEKTLAGWVDIFSEVEACVTPVLTYEEMIEHPQVIARQMIRTSNDLQLSHIGIPIKLSDTPGNIRGQAPRLGEHTQELLSKM